MQGAQQLPPSTPAIFVLSLLAGAGSQPRLALRSLSSADSGRTDWKLWDVPRRTQGSAPRCADRHGTKSCSELLCHRGVMLLSPCMCVYIYTQYIVYVQIYIVCAQRVGVYHMAMKTVYTQ